MNSTPMPMPPISPAFTVDDIHKVREWNYSRRRAMSEQEVSADTEKGAASFEALVDASRRKAAGE